jgi:hypothetical protein
MFARLVRMTPNVETIHLDTATGSASLSSSDSLSKGDHLARIFNTALISTQADGREESSDELFELMKSAPFRAILGAVKDLAEAERIPEREASERMIQAFRKLDELWSQYVYREGLERIRGPQQRPVTSFRS